MTPEEANGLPDKVKGSDPSALAELMDWKEVAEALETIAGLHYEYAVEEDAGYWLDILPSLTEGDSRYRLNLSQLR